MRNNQVDAWKRLTVLSNRNSNSFEVRYDTNQVAITTGKTYSFRLAVTAESCSMSQLSTSETSFTMQTGPSAPSYVFINQMQSNKYCVQWTWSASSSTTVTPSSFTVQYRTANGIFQNAQCDFPVSGYSRECCFTPQVASSDQCATYEAQVIAVSSSCGNSMASEIARTSISSAPAAPANLVASCATDGATAIVLSWNLPSNSGCGVIQYYEIEYDQRYSASTNYINTPGRVAIIQNAMQDSYTVTQFANGMPIVAGTVYRFQIKACNNNGCNVSNTVTASVSSSTGLKLTNLQA